MPRPFYQESDLPQGYSDTFKSRFWKNVNKEGPIPQHLPHLGPCWDWTGYKMKRYGAISPGGREMKRIPASRASWLLHVGPITDKKLFVLHKCDNRACVRPDHLFLGTQQQNVADMIAKGRARHDGNVRGEDSGTAKLKESDVRFIRSMAKGFTPDLMAQLFGVTRGAIYAILKRKVWTHI